MINNQDLLVLDKVKWWAIEEGIKDLPSKNCQSYIKISKSVNNIFKELKKIGIIGKGKLGDLNG